MPKYNSLEEYLDTLTEDALRVYTELKNFIISLDDSIKERLFAGQVAYYIEDNLKNTFHQSPVIVMSFFKDHVNIFALANVKYKELLFEYKFTSKGTMQIYYNMDLKFEYLQLLFMESLQ